MAPNPPLDNPIARELAEAVEGRYGLERELGRGGMGAVFLARDLKLDRLVAIKVLPPELAVRPELRERFLRETRTAASFSHPNIVPVHAVEESPSLLYFVMGYVEGETLSQRVQRQGPLAVADAVRLLQEIAWALSYAHGRGVVHRDVKPDNILMERATGRALVMDFGIARSAAASGLTQMGETVGTPHFMSPEQAAGDKLDGRSDLYALGLVAYYAVTGRLAFDAPTAQQVVVMQISQPAQPVATIRPDLPAALTTAIDRCLAKEPDQRFPSGEALVEALGAVTAQRVEVAPAIRLFDQQAATTVFLLLLGALAGPRITRSQWDADQLVNRIFLGGVLFALTAQLVRRARGLRLQGFSPEELQSGLRAITGERDEERARLRSSPADRTRRRRRYRIAAVALVAGVAEQWYLMTHFRTQTAPGMYQVSRPGILMAAGSVLFFAAAFIQVLTDPFRPSPVEWLSRVVFQGRFGNWLFRQAGARIGKEGTPRRDSMGSRHGALTLLETLPGDVKRRLGRARVTLERLEGEVERLERREQELESAMTDAKLGAPSLPGGASDGQQALLDDLDRARRDAAERRVAILGALESVRLSLVRVKTGIGTAEDVERALGEAAPLLAESAVP